ncbi:MAG: hypothetical protein QM753_18730 [Thermomicrobiales bacterium]
MPAGRSPGQPPRRAFGWFPTSAAWWGGYGFLRFHCSLFLTGIPLLFLVNLIQSPERIWIDRVGLAWLALLVVHAAITGIIRAVGVLREDEQSLPVRETISQPRSTWITARSTELQDADFRASPREALSDDGWGVSADMAALTEASWRDAMPVAAPAPPAGSLAQGEPIAGTSVWDGWTASVEVSRPGGRRASAAPTITTTTTTPAPQTARAADSSPDAPSADAELVSWRTVTDAAWLSPVDDSASPDDAIDTTRPPS